MQEVEALSMTSFQTWSYQVPPSLLRHMMKPSITLHCYVILIYTVTFEGMIEWCVFDTTK